MAISDRNRHRNDLAKAAIDASSLNADAKADLDEMLDDALAGTNGLDAAAKLDAVADNLYQLTRLTCVHIAEAPTSTSWRDVIIRCSWQIVAAISIVAALLALRPQLAAVLENIIK